MSENKFVHLHVHSHYSLLDGLSKLDDLVQKAVDEGMSALALTDHGVMYGAIEFYQKCKKAGIKPIIGVEAYIASEGIENKTSTDRRFHAVLLAKNDAGYKNLIKLTSIAHLKGFYYKPRIDWELLKEHKEGLICLSACQAGEFARAVVDQSIEVAEKVAQKYLDLFGEDYYLEVQHHPNLPKQKIVNDAVFKVGKKLNIPIVATNDVHYLNTEDAEAHDILICLQTKKKITDENRMSYLGEDFSLYSADQMGDYFRGNLEVLENTLRIADKCNLEISLGEIQLPPFDLPEGVTAFDQLVVECKKGIKIRYDFDAEKPETEEQKTIMERMDYELAVIEKTGYASYFLITQDFIVWSKKNDIIVGPGRGSAAGSLVAYLTEITNLDPMPYDLLFERFLNPDRVSMPDIDTDFADVRRSEVIRYVEERYGKDHVSQIITFGTMAAKAAIRDVGRVLDFPYTFCDKISKLIPLGMKLDEALDQTKELKEMYTSNSDAKRLINFARQLEGVARHTSTHACGILITPKVLTEYTPIQYSAGSEDDVVSQYSLHPVEDLGLLKMDFLGLKNLTIMENAVKIIKKMHGISIVLDDIPLDDAKTYRVFQDGRTTGVFQFESGGMKRYLKKLKPSEFEDLIAMVALYRPGPLNSGMVDEFIERKHGEKAIVYADPIMKASLKNTYGVIVYQEQVMQLSKDMAGFTGGQADTLRKAMGKKIADLMAKMKVDFIAGCENNQLSKKVAVDTFTSMEKFAEYGFNKSHAACYALISYQTAYLKANYPTEFMASLLTSDQDNMDRVAIEIDECKQMGIEVLPPDINESFTTFTVVAESLKKNEPTIRFGLKAIRNVGEGIVTEVIKERKEFGKFENFEDFLIRVKSKDLNKKSIEGLAKSGALDDFVERNNTIENIGKILLFVKAVEAEQNTNQANLFSINGESSLPTLSLIEYETASKKQRLSWEKEFLGLYVSEHPYSEFDEKIKDCIVSITDIKQGKLPEKSHVVTAGVITDIKKIITAKGDPMLFVRFEDSLNGLEILIFPKLYEELQALFVEERMILVDGNLSDKDDEYKVLANSVWELTQENYQEVLTQANRYQPKNQENRHVLVSCSRQKLPELANALKDIFRGHPGDNPVYLKLDDQLIKTSFRIKYCPSIIEKIDALLGSNKIELLHTKEKIKKQQGEWRN